MSDDLGDRMKAFESRETSRNFLPYIPVYARIDGKGFSRFTRGMERPFDASLHDVMKQTTAKLVEFSNARIGYTQSDEISLIWLVEKPKEEMMFAAKVQKLVSVMASATTAFFLPEAAKLWPELVAKKPPMFDCRIFQLPSLEEGANAILWRELDATKNAISMAASHYFSHKSLQNKSGSEMQEMLFSQEGINFNDYPAEFKRGSFMQRRMEEVYLSKETLASIKEEFRPTGPVQRRVIQRIDMPSFRKVTNRVGVIFRSEEPETAVEEI